jgi:hypothetical protein
MVLYVHPDGEKITFCYEHLFEIIGRRKTYLPKLSHTMPKGFNIKDYLNSAHEKIANKPLLDEKVQETMLVITEILDKTGLSRYIGGFAEINTGGPRESSPLIPAFA